MLPTSAHSLRVALVEMPFGPVAWPSIGTSVLKPQLARRGHRAEVVYLNQLMLELLGPPDSDTVGRYQAISDAFGVHLGEWVFARAAFPDCRDQAALDDEYLSRLRTGGFDAATLSAALDLRDRADEFLTRCLAEVPWSDLDVVGFANSYSQLNASLALARLLSMSFPALRLIIGGCGCADVMGVATLRVCEHLCAAVLGEGDEIIADLAEAVVSNDEARLRAIPGIAFRSHTGKIELGAPQRRVTDLDALPVPDYSDYSRNLAPALRTFLPFYIPVEASRGCWWGAKHHCTFCGLNPQRISYARKEPARFLAEIATLTATYQPRRFMAVDNIMPHDYHTAVIPELTESSGGAEFFFEVKANFRREQLEAFTRANVRQIQPGIESLRTPVLKLMEKGTTAIANVYTLRLCEDLGVRAHWSILFGFAGETLDDYRVSSELTRRIMHLRPPLALVPVEVERFSPMYRRPAEHGLTGLRPSTWYYFCHPVSAEVLADLSYRFVADFVGRPAELSSSITTMLEPLVERWRASYGDGAQALWTPAGRNHEVRRRVGGEEWRYILDTVCTALLDELDEPRGLRALFPQAATTLHEPYLDPEFLRTASSAMYEREVTLRASSKVDAYQQLLRHGLIVQESGHAVSVVCRRKPSARRELRVLAAEP
ncbi:MAG: RiPP maturation radical SAM C-methyltransferase [Myxococcales bacterium]